MKLKITKKQIRESFKNIICVGYEDLAYLFYYRDADFYSTRVEGWACDYYKIDNNTIISTGYSPIGNIENFDINRKYDEMARKIVLDHKLDYDFSKKVKKLDKLIEKYIAEILEDNYNEQLKEFY